MTVMAGATERAAFADAVRACLAKHTGPRPSMADEAPASIDVALWRTLADQLGLGALVIQEDLGGAGGSWGDLAVAIEELGARLTPVPALASSAMATGLLLGTDGSADLLGRLAEGAIASVVWPGVGPSGAPQAPTVTGRPSGGSLRLTGTASFVLNGVEADFLVVPATDEDGLVLAVVEGTAAGLLRGSMTTLDLTRPMAEIAFDGVPATVIAGPDNAAEILGHGFDIALTMLAVESVGVAQACLDSAVAYVKDRVQFDRPIGSFQAIKHRLVDLLLELELARSAADAAVLAAEDYRGGPGPASARALRAAASMAKAMCGESAVLVARETLHLFGGIGFTWEHDAHLYYRRAKANELLLGDPAAHRVRLAATVGI